MKVRSTCLCVALLCCTSAATFIACASDETPSGPAPEPGASTIPAPADAGVDAAEADAEIDASEPALPCTDDVLCPFGPFQSSTEGGPIAARTRINAIRARGPSDVWVVGVSGAVAHYDGTSWKRLETGSLEAMRAVWLRENDEVAIASLSSMYRHNFDAADAGVDAGPPSAGGWTAVGKPLGGATAADTVTSAWTTPGAEWVWITSLAPYSETTRNGIWRLHVVPATNQLQLANPIPSGNCAGLDCNQMTSVHGFSADDLWVVGSGGEILHITQAQSTAPKLARFDSQTWAELDGVWAASETEAWAVGGRGVVRHYTGHPYAWDVVTDVPTTETLRAVWGSSPTDVWAVGDAATVLHYDGTSWSRVEIADLGSGRPDLLTVWSPAPGRVWIGGVGVFLSLGGKP